MTSDVFHAPHLIAPQAFDKYPLNWDEIFRRDAPFGIEIGFGNGEFLVDWALKQPGWNFVGIDSSLGSSQRLQKRTMHYSVDNVRIINNDARFCLRELFSNNSIHHIVMNFPDPWPKKRHRERRMLQPSFIQTLGAVLINRGMFELVTDQKWLAQDFYKMVRQANRFFELNSIEENPVRPLRTKYEKKWQDSGCCIYRVCAIKIRDTAISRMLEDSKMPHYIIENEIYPEQVIPLKNSECVKGNHLFVFKEIYTDFEGNCYLVHAITRDNDYQQSFYSR